MRLDELRLRARKLKAEVFALYLAYKDPRVPWYAKGIIACVVAYALSPIDLIPDFVPVLGYLDDLILVPFGISVALRMVPRDVTNEYRVKAESLLAQKPKKSNWVAGGLIMRYGLEQLTWSSGPTGGSYDRPRHIDSEGLKLDLDRDDAMEMESYRRFKKRFTSGF